ncbi:MAG: type-F conjugative transfer system secretin TraK [Proteobacteria bacterium]|nr:type-F conjugative transfer system secretin TraK [Pseudomonadota bacterium]
MTAGAVPKVAPFSAQPLFVYPGPPKPVPLPARAAVPQVRTAPPATKPVVPPKPAAPGARPEATAAGPAIPTRDAKGPQWMPGFSNGVSGDPESTKPNVVLVSLDRAELIQISGDFANRIATPFRSPKATGIVDPELVTIEQEGQSLFVQVKNDQAVALFISDAALPNSPVLSVTLVPRRGLPPQTIVLQPQGTGLGGEATHKSNDLSDTYSGMLRDWLREVAAGRAPRGFTESSFRGVAGAVDPFVVRPVKRYAGARFDIFHYILEVASGVASGVEVEIDEDSFSSEGVRAVAIFPRQRLVRGDLTNVFVVADKPDDDRAAGTVRMENR